MSDVSTTSSAMTGAGGGDKLRLLGMSTGLDVDSMVKKMLTGEQSKLDKAKQQQQTIQWKQDAYQDIIKDIKGLQSSFFDVNSSDSNILSSTNFAPFTVTGVNGSTVDTSVATFTPGVGVQTGKYSIAVTQLAAGGGLDKTNLTTSAGAKATLSTKLTDIDPSLANDIRLSLNVSGTTTPINITLNNSNTATSGTATYTATLGDLINAINNQSGGKVKAVYSELTGELKLNNTTTGSDSTLTINAGTTANLSSILGSGNSAFGNTGVTLAAGTAISNTALTDSSALLTSINGSLTGSITLKLNDGSGDTTVTLDNSASGFNGAATLQNLIDAINAQAGGKFTASCDASGFNLKANTGTASLSVVNGTNSGLLSVFNLTGTTSDVTMDAGAAVTNTAITDGSTKLTAINSSLTGPITLKLNTGSGDTTITLDNSAAGFNGNATIQNLVDAINAQAGGSVTATCDANGFNLKANTSTASLKIVSGTNSGLLGVFGLTTGGGTAQSGQNAHVTITPPGGTPVDLNDDSSSSITKTNNFTIDGMAYTLSSVSPVDASNNPISTSVNVGSDTSKVYDKINDFITKYNTVIDKIQTKLTEKKNKDYSPLTDSQKSSMSESQITAWETKAKVGILRNDDNLQNILNDLRSAFNTAVSNTGISFGKYGSTAIGIDFSDDPTQPGHIEIADPSKLKAAISSNPDQILKMFTNVSKQTDGKTKYTMDTNEYQEDGIFNRVKTIFEKNVGYTNTTLNFATLTSYANQQNDYSSTGTGGKGTIPDQLYEQQLMVKKITTEMSDLQERYYKQFSDLETAMTTLNAQQSQLSSMLGG